MGIRNPGLISDDARQGSSYAAPRVVRQRFETSGRSDSDELIESGSVALYRKSSAHGAARHPADGQNGGLLPPFGGLSYCAICRRHARAQNCAPPHDGRAAESLCGSWVCAGRTLHRELCRNTASDGRFRVVLLGDPSALWLGHEAYGCAVASPPSVNSCRSNCAEACGITSERRV